MLRHSLGTVAALSLTAFVAAGPAGATVGAEVAMSPVPRTLVYGETLVLHGTVDATTVGSWSGTLTFTDNWDDAGVPRMTDRGTFQIDADRHAESAPFTPVPGSHWFSARYDGRSYVEGTTFWSAIQGWGGTGPLTVTKAPLQYAVAPVTMSWLPMKATFSVLVTSQVTGKGVAGVPVTLSATPLLGKAATCTATTDAWGTAACSVQNPGLVGGRVVTATSPETAYYLAGSGTSR